MTRFPLRLLAASLALAGATATAAPTTYAIDPAHTDVIAQWNHFGYSNPTAHFGQAEGTIVHDPDDIAASRVEVTLPLAGLQAYSEKFDAHLRSDDFFDADRYPVARFRSTGVEAAGDGRLKVTGELTIRDVTRTVVLDTTINAVSEHPMTGRPSAGFDATTTLKRSDFGLGLYAPAVSDEVRIRITTEAVAEAAAEE